MKHTRAMMEEMRKNEKIGSSGQVLLIVVVTMVVALTVGLSLLSRTITNLKLSKQSDDSQRAFQAASAGIDKYINQAGGGLNTLDNATFNTTVIPLQSNEILLNNGDPVDQDRGIDVWLSGYPSFSPQYDGSLIVYWGDTNQTQCAVGQGKNTRAALEILLLRGTVTNPTVTKLVYDSCAAIRGNNFTAPAGGGSVAGTTLNNSSASLIFSAPAGTAGLIMKVIPIYNSARIAVRFVPAAGITAPAQGKLIESTGTSGDTKRKISYFESYPQIPNEVLPYSILSQ